MKTKSTLQQIVELSSTPKEYRDKQIDITIYHGKDKKHIYIYYNKAYNNFTIYKKWNNNNITSLASFKELNHAISNLPVVI